MLLVALAMPRGLQRGARIFLWLVHHPYNSYMLPLHNLLLLAEETEGK